MPGRRPIDIPSLLASAARHHGHTARIALDLDICSNTVRRHRARLRIAAPQSWPWANRFGGTPEHLGEAIRHGPAPKAR